MRTRPMCWLAIGFLLIISILLWGRSDENVLPFLEPGKIVLEGMIEDKQYKESVYGSYWQVTLKNVRVLSNSPSAQGTEDITDKNKNINCIEKVEGKFLCQISAGEAGECKIGQTVLLEGIYEMWEEPTNPEQFNFGKYYVSQGILGQFKKCKIFKQGNSCSKFQEEMWLVRQKSLKLLEWELGEEDGTVISAMLLGEKSGLDKEQKGLYQRNGISHILAISGLHLTLLGTGIFRVLKTLLASHRKAAVVSMIIMSLYCVFTGNSISTIRATIMFVLSFIAEILGRSYDSLSALGLAAILQLFMNPYVLNNSGFLLSFLAVVGVIFIAPRLQEMMGAKGKFGKSLCVSLSATITTLPVLLRNYGTYPWYSVFLNLMILPFMSILLFLAVVLLVLCWGKEFGFFGILAEGVGIKNIVVWGMKWILEYFEWCCRMFEQVAVRDRYIGSPTVVQIILYACMVALALSGGVRYFNHGRKMILLSALSILTLNLSFGAEVTMLDVGQGDSIVICNDNGNIYISDCGSSSVSQVGKYRLLPFLKQKGYGKIKGIFISHLDEDHISGIVELLEEAPAERIEIQYVFMPESVLLIEEDREKIEELQALAKETGAQLVYLVQGDRITDGRMSFACLYPQSEESVSTVRNKEEIIRGVEKGKGNSGKNRNNQSLVILLQYEEFDMLLTGDIEEAGEMELSKEIDRMSLDVLKVAHHGSSGSSSEEFLEVLNPKLSLISCGKNNSYGHPHEETLERLEAVGSNVLSTVESGAITLKIGRKIKVYEFKK